MSSKKKTNKLHLRKSRKHIKTTRERKPKRRLQRNSRKGKRKMTRRGGQFNTPPRNENSNVNPPPIERNSNRNTTRTLPLPSNLLSRFQQMDEEDEEAYTDEEDVSGGKKKKGGQSNKRKGDLEESGGQKKKMDIDDENDEDVNSTMVESDDYMTIDTDDEDEMYIKMTNEDADRILRSEREVQQIIFNRNIIDDEQYEEGKNLLLKLLFPKNTDFSKMTSLNDAYRASSEGNNLFSSM